MTRLLALTCLAACGGAPATTPDAPGTDPIGAIYAGVDQAQLDARLHEFAMTERWSPPAKASFRAYYRQYMEGLGLTVNESTFPIPNLVGETQGHNIEGVLPGASADSLVIITHYDTVGIDGHEAENPGVDDDGSGTAMMMEAARLFAAIPDRQYTVRFVAADYEEISDDLDGDYAYVKALEAEAASGGFSIIAASDDDQTGWSCWSEGLCRDNSIPKNTTFQVIDCSGDKHHYDYPDLGAGMLDVAKRYGSSETPEVVCDGSGDTDHYPFWVAGIPAYVIEEYGSENNPHYDDTGDDTMAHLDLDLLTATSRIQIAFQAQLAGIGTTR